MKFVTKDPEQVLLIFPIPDGWEIRITTNEGYVSATITIEQAWQMVNLIHDCDGRGRIS